jgi:FAD:protein FMN transferase
MKIFFTLCCFLFFGFQIFAQQLQVMRSDGYAQGTTYSIQYYDSQNRNFDAEFTQLLANFDLIFSGYDSSSIVSRINRNENHVIVDSLFIECFDKSMKISEQTKGDFDITVGPLVNAWGFGTKQKKHVDSLIIDSLLKFVGYKNVFIFKKSVIKKDKRITLDFNAIAQGYSTDLVSRFLLSKGVANFLINIGGEVYANGFEGNGDSWKVGIEMPNENHSNSLNPIKATLMVKDLAVSTSGNYRKFYVENGIKYSHEINPHTGYPAKNNLLSATVVTKDCASADGYATALMVMGLDKSIAFLQSHSEIDAFLYYSKSDGSIEIYKTNGIDAMLKKTFIVK